MKPNDMRVRRANSALGVAYVLDGSVRMSGPELRVAPRLIRANTGYLAANEALTHTEGRTESVLRFAEALGRARRQI
jgi:TolB-like protein